MSKSDAQCDVQKWRAKVKFKRPVQRYVQKVSVNVTSRSDVQMVRQKSTSKRDFHKECGVTSIMFKKIIS